MQNRRRADNIVPTMIVKVAIGNIVSQNNQRNALPNGLGGVSLQTYEYDAMNRLTHSSGGNSDAGVSYNFQQTYSPSGRIGDKFCDFTSQNDGFYYDASGYQMHALRKTMDGTTGAPCDFVYDENGNMQGYSIKEGAFVSYNIWNAANQMVATGNTRACGYYGYGYDGKRRYKLTGKTSVMSANAGDVVMDFSFDDYVLYPNSFLTGTPRGYTKHYYAGSERIASRLMNCWHFNKNLDQYLNDSEQQILDALALSNEQFDFTFNERPQYMNYYVPDSVVDIQGNKIANTGGMPILNLARYFKGDDVVHYNCEMLADNDCKSELVFTHSDHLGSSSWTTDANGHAIQHIEYLPFGEEFVNQRTTSYEDRYTFTGKELDSESNLYYYDARYNSSTYSQFTSPDPMSDKLPNFNPYLYCYGNPIKFIDPDGRYGYTDNEGSYIWFDNIQTKGTFTDNKGKEWAYVTSNKHDWDEATTIRNAVILFLFITTTNEFHQIEKDVALFDEKSCLFTKEVKLMNANRYINDWIKAFSTNSEGDSFTSNNKVGSYTLKFYEYKGDKKRGERNVVGIVKADFLDHVKEASKELLERIIFQDKADNDPMFDMHYDNANGLLEFLTQPAQLKQSK